MVLSLEPIGNATVPAIKWRSRTQENDFLPLSMRDPTQFEGAALAWKKGLADAHIKLADLQFVETHDCFTVAELLEYEAMGLAPYGQGARVILDGVSTMQGKLPVNPSGGLKSRGHPIGATGVSQHVMAAMQLSATAGKMQVANANLGAVFNMGGAAVANYLSILETA
jgi:acetyl-CoA C-acetyltransferase